VPDVANEFLYSGGNHQSDLFAASAVNAGRKEKAPDRNSNFLRDLKAVSSFYLSELLKNSLPQDIRS